MPLPILKEDPVTLMMTAYAFFVANPGASKDELRDHIVANTLDSGPAWAFRYRLYRDALVRHGYTDRDTHAAARRFILTMDKAQVQRHYKTIFAQIEKSGGVRLLRYEIERHKLARSLAEPVDEREALANARALNVGDTVTITVELKRGLEKTAKIFDGVISQGQSRLAELDRAIVELEPHVPVE